MLDQAIRLYGRDGFQRQMLVRYRSARKERNINQRGRGAVFAQLTQALTQPLTVP